MESNSQSFAHPPRKGIPTETETLRRQAFQAAHPEVGFAFRLGWETPWVAYWLTPGGERRLVTGGTLAAVLDALAGGVSLTSR